MSTIKVYSLATSTIRLKPARTKVGTMTLLLINPVNPMNIERRPVTNRDVARALSVVNAFKARKDTMNMANKMVGPKRSFVTVLEYCIRVTNPVTFVILPYTIVKTP